MKTQKNENEYQFDVDVVVTWVDDSDDHWVMKRNEYSGISSLNGNARYRDMGTFEYFFKGMERFAPWVRNIFVVTDNQRPDFEIRDPRVKFIDHKDYIPANALPTFNSNTIEMNFDLIPGLAQHFILFNDDTLLVKETHKSDFFSKKGLPKDYAVLDFHKPREEYDHIIMNDMILINNAFDKVAMFKKNVWKYASPQYGPGAMKSLMCVPWVEKATWRNLHLPVAYLKSQFQEVHQAFPELRERQNMHRFRTKDDISHWLVRYWRLAKGEFAPAAFQKFGIFTTIENDVDQEELKTFLLSQYKMIALNDNDDLTVDVSAVKGRISALLNECMGEGY